MKRVVALIFLGLAVQPLFAQIKVREADILFKKHIIRSVPLSQPSNQALFGKENMIVRILLEAYERGELTGYKQDDCNEVLAVTEFQKKMICSADSSIVYSYPQISIIELGEDLIVDRNRSEIVFNMNTLTLFLPVELSSKGILEPLVTFRYEDCVKVFREDERAVSLNPLLNGRNINYSEVFLLRLFTSQIVKIGNENDLYFDQVTHNELQAFLAGKKAENELSEYLYKLFNPK